MTREMERPKCSLTQPPICPTIAEDLQIAAALVAEGLHPLDETSADEARVSEGGDRDEWVKKAFETVRAVVRRLRKQGILDERPAGRPRRG